MPLPVRSLRSSAFRGYTAPVNAEKITDAFVHRKAFIPLIACGDPNLETAAVRAAVDNGADLVEQGILFSDPTAEVSVIQGASLRALKCIITTDQIFGLVRDLRRDVMVPLVFMTYANVVFSCGGERVLFTCKNIGTDGLILPDPSFEEKEKFLPFCKQYGVDLIFSRHAHLRKPHRHNC